MYWGLVDRPNLMIKIPATDEGIPAIEQALYEGMNVNVTLLFAVVVYEQRDGGVHPRDGAPPRRRAGRSTATRSPRSSSRASTPRSTSGSRRSAATDLAGPRRARQRPRRLPGVPARLRRRALRRRCARPARPVQRPLWASTGVKNPAYPETMYVYGLVGRDTVNTMPLPTLTAAAREGEVTGATRRRRPDAPTSSALRDAGIDLDDVTDKLLRDGIDAFVVPMNKLLDGIESKREAIVTGRPDDDRRRPAGRARAGRRRAPAPRRRTTTSCTASGTATARCGRRRARPRSTDRLGWLDIAEKMLDGRRRPRGLRATRSRADGLHRRRAARHGRLEPRARGLPPLVAGPAR